MKVFHRLTIHLALHLHKSIVFLTNFVYSTILCFLLLEFLDFHCLKLCIITRGSYNGTIMVCATVCSPYTGVCPTFIAMVTLKTGQPVPLEEGTGTASETDINGVGGQTRTVHTHLLTTTLPLYQGQPKPSQLLVHFTGGMGKGRKGGSGGGYMRRRASPSGWCSVTVHNQSGAGPVQHSLIALFLIFLTRWLEIHRLGMIFNLL